MVGVGFGYDSETSLFKTNADSKITSASLTDSLTNVWFSGLPDVENNGTTYANHYFELYSLVAASVDNDITFSKSLMSIAPLLDITSHLEKVTQFLLTVLTDTLVEKKKLKMLLVLFQKLQI